MKPFRVACVVSALTATASGVSINPSPASTTLSDTPQKFELPLSAQMLNRRRSIRWPLPRILKRAQALKQKHRAEKRDLFRRQIQSQLSALNQRTSSVFPEVEEVEYPRLTPMQLSSGSNELSYQYFEARSSDIPRRVAQGGIPGFVEVAIPDQNAGVARTVSGLAYSMSPDHDSDLELGTSASHSTQFFLSPVNNTSLYRLKAQLLGGSNTNTLEHCATFATSPSAPLSMKNCGDISGFSQCFSYDHVSGELKPVYTNSVSDKENLPTKPTNKRRRDESLTFERLSSLPSKRAAMESSQSSAVLYFVPAADVKKSN